MARRIFLVAMLLPMLIACRHVGDAAQDGAAREVVFYDAAGNRMVVGITGPTGEEAKDAPATSASPQSPPVQGGASVATVAGASDDAITFNGETFIDVDAFERDMDSREGERFYVVPDGTGKRQTLKQSELDPAGAPAPAAAVPAVRTAAPDACGEAVRLPLMPVEARDRQNLTFPIVEDGKRYAGYLVPVPAGAAGTVSVWAWVKNKKRVAVSLGVVDNSGAVVGAVNNIATETEPETMFRYGRTGGRVALEGLAAPGESRRIAVMDGYLVARRMPLPCRGIMGDRAQFSPEGLVSLDFRVSAGN